MLPKQIRYYTSFVTWGNVLKTFATISYSKEVVLGRTIYPFKLITRTKIWPLMDHFFIFLRFLNNFSLVITSLIPCSIPTSINNVYEVVVRFQSVDFTLILNNNKNPLGLKRGNHPQNVMKDSSVQFDLVLDFLPSQIVTEQHYYHGRFQYCTYYIL